MDERDEECIPSVTDRAVSRCNHLFDQDLNALAEPCRAQLDVDETGASQSRRAIYGCGVRQRIENSSSNFPRILWSALLLTETVTTQLSTRNGEKSPEY